MVTAWRGQDGMATHGPEVQVPAAAVIIGGRYRSIPVPPGVARDRASAWRLGLGMFVLVVGGWGLIFVYAVAPLASLVGP